MLVRNSPLRSRSISSAAQSLARYSSMVCASVNSFCANFSVEGRTPVPRIPTQQWARSAISKRSKLADRSEEHTSELQSLMRISYAVFCLKKNTIGHMGFPLTAETWPVSNKPKEKTQKPHTH